MSCKCIADLRYRWVTARHQVHMHDFLRLAVVLRVDLLTINPPPTSAASREGRKGALPISMATHTPEPKTQAPHQCAECGSSTLITNMNPFLRIA